MSINKMPNKPFVNIMPQSEVYDSIGKTMVAKHADYDLLCFLDVVDDPLTYQEQVIADFEKKFIACFTLPDSDGKRTCISCVPRYNEIKGMEEDMPFYGVAFGLSVYYQQLTANPSGQTET
jgi:hypothetical protein